MNERSTFLQMMLMPSHYATARKAIAVSFFAMGFAVSAAATRLSEIKESLGVSDDIFGYALATTTLGGLVGNTQANRIIVRLGTKRVAQVFSILMMVSVGLYGSATQVGQLAGLAFCAALGYSILNIAVNTQGVDVEGHLRRSVMPGFHGSWSIGSLATSVVGAAVAAFVSPQQHLLSSSAFAIAVMLLATTRLLPVDHIAHDSVSHKEPIPRATLRILAITAAGSSLGLIAEISALDWSNIYLRESLGIGTGLNALGVTSFLVAQIAARLVGGRLNDRFGVHRVVRIGGLVGATGYATSLLANAWLLERNPELVGSTQVLVIACLGFVILGLGVAALPAAYLSSAGRIAGISTARGIAMLAVMNSLAMLVLRPIISWLAGNVSLTASLTASALALIGSALLARILKPTAPL
jgi:MFS family permease